MNSVAWAGVLEGAGDLIDVKFVCFKREYDKILVCEQPLIRQGTRGYDVTQEGITCRPLNLFNHYCEILTSLLGLDRALTEAVLPKWLTSSDQSQDEGS